MRRQPPYARQSAADNPPPDARVTVGDHGWLSARTQLEANNGRFWRRFAVCPSDADPMALDWFAFDGCEVLLGWHKVDDPQLVHRCAMALLRDGATMVVSICHDGTRPMSLYEPVRGAE